MTLTHAHTVHAGGRCAAHRSARRTRVPGQRLSQAGTTANDIFGACVKGSISARCCLTWTTRDTLPDADVHVYPITQGERALGFVLGNKGMIDKTLMFDIELVRILQ